ncbi:hypothetical protein SAMN04487926_105275 [Paraburkholderia steynii]|uniref:Uncharacterized protein n=1 Tax=Paraburkholderia steynii TaxID=1245441 RepID=A0A7Z7FHQ0_9BURK|nr:hypothetical protein [Paraburkholderia steynii]SDH55424.1 hypothetical protein SAMN04487926_105275 [Paraburkholderia steynii]
MNRKEFLAQPSVQGFVTWLARRLPELSVRLRVAHSRYVPGGIDEQVSGLEAVLAHYHWRASWYEPRTCKPVESGDWASTRASLERLGAWLRESVANGDELEAGAAAREILRWGGVSSAIPFIESKVRKNEWCAYLKELAPLFALDGDQALEALHAGNVERFDSGMTKIHALFDTTGSPIYDSRVGAALAMLYEMFRGELGREGVQYDALGFPSGPARGPQIRNPVGLGLTASPQFYTPQVRPEEWARWQLKTGWIIRAVLEQTALFASELAGKAANNIAARCHAFEAALFMIGYDIRSLGGDDGIHTAPDAGGSPPTPDRSGNWVPVGHPFGSVLSVYRAYRETSPADPGIDAFGLWLQANPRSDMHVSIANNFANYQYPLGEREFNLPERTLEHVQSIGDGKEGGLLVANNGEPEFIAGDEREQVCLVCAGLTGYCYAADPTPEARTERLIRTGFAGTRNSANTLLSVGRGVGTHFGLLDRDFQPTDLFRRFFRDGFDDFRNRLGVDR